MAFSFRQKLIRLSEIFRISLRNIIKWTGVVCPDPLGLVLKIHRIPDFIRPLKVGPINKIKLLNKPSPGILLHSGTVAVYLRMINCFGGGIGGYNIMDYSNYET